MEDIFSELLALVSFIGPRVKFFAKFERSRIWFRDIFEVLTLRLLENSAIKLANGIFEPHGVELGLSSMSLTYPEKTRT
jgi:hypothetical protein